MRGDTSLGAAVKLQAYRHGCGKTHQVDQDVPHQPPHSGVGVGHGIFFQNLHGLQFYIVALLASLDTVVLRMYHCASLVLLAGVCRALGGDEQLTCSGCKADLTNDASAIGCELHLIGKTLKP